MDVPDEKGKLIEEMQDWALYNGWAAVSAFFAYDQHNALPYSGGWLEQPETFRADFITLSKVKRLYELLREKPNG